MNFAATRGEHPRQMNNRPKQNGNKDEYNAVFISRPSFLSPAEKKHRRHE